MFGHSTALIYERSAFLRKLSVQRIDEKKGTGSFGDPFYIQDDVFMGGVIVMEYMVRRCGDMDVN